MQSLSEFCPKHDQGGIGGPDVAVCCLVGEQWRKVGMELTEYLDDPHGGVGIARVGATRKAVE